MKLELLLNLKSVVDLWKCFGLRCCTFIRVNDLIITSQRHSWLSMIFHREVLKLGVFQNWLKTWKNVCQISSQNVLKQVRRPQRVVKIWQIFIMSCKSRKRVAYKPAWFLKRYRITNLHLRNLLALIEAINTRTFPTENWWSYQFNKLLWTWWIFLRCNLKTENAFMKFLKASFMES